MFTIAGPVIVYGVSASVIWVGLLDNHIILTAGANLVRFCCQTVEKAGITELFRQSVGWPYGQPAYLL